jgi:O-antigen biosynthesis protein
MSHPGTLIIRTRQKRPVLELFLHSLWATVNNGTKIVFVDDGSEYPVRSLVAHSQPACLRDCKTLFLEHDVSRGSASCLNEALGHVEGDVVYIVDTDVLLLNDWQDGLRRSLEADPRHGAVGATLLYPQTGGVQHCGIAFSRDVGRHLFLNARPQWIPSSPFKVQAIVFALCAIRRQVVEAVGHVDEEYHNAYEDLDYFLRVRREGYTVLMNTDVKSYHWELSDGPHRSVNRKRNLGRFWRLWGSYIEEDIWLFIEAALRDVLSAAPDGATDGLRLIDLCEERPEARRFQHTLARVALARVADYLDLSYRVGHQQEIWLPHVLGVDGHRGASQYLFLVDNFVRLLGNRYWIQLRATHRDDDLVADLHGNVVRLRELFEAAWPGSKIR